MARPTAAFCLLLPCLLSRLAALDLPTGATAVPLLAPLTDSQQVALPELDPAVPSPARHLGYPLGERFTRHAEILGYLRALDAASPAITLWQYGETYEHRPLVLLAISTPENIARLDALRADRAQLDRTHALPADARSHLLADMPTVVWLGYGVHGNESSSAEAAMAAAYTLAAGRGPGAPDLRKLVVLLDPLLNPDGRERYVNNYLARRGSTANPDPAALEHSEPWPGGRGNHYYIDMNRDWAWASQLETRARVAEMDAWEPQVYVDFHEMSADATYFFPPTAEPHHPAFGGVTKRWLETFGRANAAAFDGLGWPYYVGEEFDFFYPAYGDTYPTLRGGVGMTYEVAGGGGAGSVVEREGSGRWSLADRVARHLATSLATVATAAAQQRQLLADFVATRDAQSTGAGQLFTWRTDQQEAAELAELLQRHGIAVGRLKRDEEIEAQPLSGGAARKVRLPAGSWAVSTAQPLGALARALLEREATLPEAWVERQRERASAHLDPQFYDVTAWALPLAYNVEAWVGAGDRVSLAEPPPSGPAAGAVPAAKVGYLVPPSGLETYRFAAALLREGIPFRVGLEGTTAGARSLPAGTLFVPRSGRADIATALAPLALDAGVELVPVDTSFSTAGIPLGSERMVPVRKPRIGVVAGPGVSSTSFGALWHLLDRIVGLEHSVLDISSLASSDLSRFSALLLPEGGGYGRLGDEEVARLTAWVSRGGVLVAVGGAVDWLHGHDLSAVAARKLDEASEEGDDEGGGASAADTDRVWETELMVPGSIVATEMRHHPLTAGVPAPPPVLFWGDTFHDATGDPQQDVLRVRGNDPLLAGVAWSEAREQLPGALLVAAEEHGDGQVVVFTQDPAFRLFWRGTMPLLLNALMYGPSIP
jgi:hypothetical protein